MPVAVLALLSTGAFGKGKIYISSYLKTDYAIITAQHGNSENYRVRIYDEAGSELYSSLRINGSSAFQKLFDLSTLEDGKYSIELKSKKETSVEEFVIKGNRLASVVGSKEDSSLLNAFFRVSDNKLYVSHMNFSNAGLQIRIGDEYGTDVYSSDLPSEGAYSGMFDVTNLPTGDYTVLLISGDKEYNYEFSK